MKRKNQYQVLKINIKHFIKTQDKEKTISPLSLTKEEKKEFYIKQDSTFVFYQLERLRGYFTQNIEEIIFLEAKHNKKQHDLQTEIFNNGLILNGKKYLRFGKSNSQAKDGITVFMIEDVFKDMMKISHLDLNIKNTVIPKYESYRNLIFSSCTIINEKLPYIVILDEYTKTIPNQFIRYVVREDDEFVDKETKEIKKYEKREIEEGYKDLEISPFDGCGCHTPEYGELISKHLDKDYIPASLQVRLPMTKGLSVEVDFKQYFRDNEIKFVIDAYGNKHNIEDIDCLWNTSMWKGHKYFKSEFGNNAWNVYLSKINKYDYKMGISKYSHHTKDMDLKRRFNFQYFQTLDLVNEKYVKKFNEKDNEYNILDKSNDGKIIELARYSTNLMEKIIGGDKFYSLKFLGITDTENTKPNAKYLEAVLINDIMLKDPMIKKLLKNTTKKTIEQMKYGKIYMDGFFHTIVGDMQAYLEFAGNKEVVGSLDEWSVYLDTVDSNKATLFRSPCVCSSEVSNVKIQKDIDFKKYIKNWDSQDIVMFSARDILMPQLGGADADGDICFVCTSDTVYDSKIEKPIIIDIEDKATAKSLDYTKENITQYELNSRDSRIGEITNIATSILNNHTTNEKWKKINDHNISLLRIYQGKEIDFLKTGKRWIITKSLRKYLKKLPYFLMYNYPKKMSVYNKRVKQNKNYKDKIEYNCFHSPSPMNELCDYIDTWEKEKVLWSKETLNTSPLLLNNEINLDDDLIFRKCREVISNFSKEWVEAIREDEQEKRSLLVSEIYSKYKKEIFEIDETIDKETLANYFIKASTYRTQINKHLCWEVFGDIMLDNLRMNSNQSQSTKISECKSTEEGCYEFLGKYYKMEESDIGS